MPALIDLTPTPLQKRGAKTLNYKGVQRIQSFYLGQ